MVKQFVLQLAVRKTDTTLHDGFPKLFVNFAPVMLRTDGVDS